MLNSNKFFYLYDTVILKKPFIGMFLLLVLLGLSSIGIKNFRLDASADSLILENDDDLKYHRKIAERYKSLKYLLLAYTPKDNDLFSESTRNNIRELRDELKKLERVHSIVTILDVPLFKSPKIPIGELKNKVITLESKDVDIEKAKKEFSESPLYFNMLISEDLKSTAIQINYDSEKDLDKIISKKNRLLTRKLEGGLNDLEKEELKMTNLEYKVKRDEANKIWKEDITKVRAIVKRYQGNANIFLGGVPMIANDMIAFVQSDLKIFGSGMLIFLIVTLGLIFRKIKWVLLPMFCCIYSVIAMIGILGLLRWDITVISSNFISLQLIITMALSIHLVVRFNELFAKNPNARRYVIMRNTLRGLLMPCLYTSLTTIAGFLSLLACGILPVVNFGWMMTIGLCISFITTFTFFPASVMLFHKMTPKPVKTFPLSLTGHFARYTEKHGFFVLVISLTLAIITVIGIARLKVENSFIDYFKKSTEIYKGMKMVDQNLGGTTPLDVIISFGSESESEPKTADKKEINKDDEFADFEDFVEEEEDSKEKYWFTRDKIDIIQKVHTYLSNEYAIGKVMSLCTMLTIVNDLNNGKDLDSFDLALLFKEMPDAMKEIAVSPYISIEDNQARISVRIKDSLKGLNRNLLLKNLKNKLKKEVGLKDSQFRFTNLMVLYNNMLQSLFKSQITTIGFTVIALMIMFIILFKSVKIALVAIFPNLLSSLTILGVMGLLSIPLDMMTITIVAISIGIAVDNTIHYIYRFQKEFKKDKNYLKTMYRCHLSIGNAMYYTSITIIVGFSILSFSNFIPGVLFGLLTSLAMLMALLSALTLLPKLIILVHLFGPENENVKSEIIKS